MNLGSTRMTVAEFLGWQSGLVENWELDDGIPVLSRKARFGASQSHDRVVVNTLGHLSDQLRGSVCRPSTDNIALVTGSRSVRRPDITVQCAEADPRSMTSVDPRLLVEVLSPETVDYDRVKALLEYRGVTGLVAIVLIDTEQPRLTITLKSQVGSWDSVEYVGLDAAFDLPMIGARLALADIFEGVHAA